MTPSGETPVSLGFLEQLESRAAAVDRALVFPEGDDERVLDAVAILAGKRLARPIVLGDRESTIPELGARGVEVIEGPHPSMGTVGVVDPLDPDRVAGTSAVVRESRAGKGVTEEWVAQRVADPLVVGASMVATGVADGGVAGAVRTTGDVVRAGLLAVGLAPGVRTLSSAFYMVFAEEHPRGPEVLSFTDAGVVPSPDAERLVDIAVSASDAHAKIVGEVARVAFLSYSTKGSAEGPSVDRGRAALEGFRAQRPMVAADGELQGDAALVPAIADRKSPGSPISGRANVLVFPDLDSANIAYKLVQHLGGATALGPILLGLRKPFSDLSRGASVDDIVRVACVTALMG